MAERTPEDAPAGPDVRRLSGACIVLRLLAGEGEPGVMESCDVYDPMPTGPCGRIALASEDVEPAARQATDIAVLDFDSGLCEHSPAGVVLEA